MAKSVVDWLSGSTWEVYQEVQPKFGDPVADIVAVQGPLVWVIEVKCSFGFSVLDQANHWKGHANLISVATPPSPADLHLKRKILGLMGIGWLGIYSDYAGGLRVEERYPPYFHRKISKTITSALREEHKTWAMAGNNSSERFTPFKKTCMDILIYIKNHPGCGIKEIVNNVPTHYRSHSTARACLSMWVQQGKVPGVKSEFDEVSKKWKFFPTT